jgi:hypothetical protein
MGKVYLVMRPLRGNNAFDTYLLPDNLLLDGATKDQGLRRCAMIFQNKRLHYLGRLARWGSTAGRWRIRWPTSATASFSRSSSGAAT